MGGRRARAAWSWTCLALALAACIFSLARACAWRDGLAALLGARAYWIPAVELAAPLACVLAFRGTRALGAGSSLRALLAGLGCAWVAFLLCVPAYQRLWLELALGPACAIVAACVAFERASAVWRPSRARAARAALLTLGVAPFGLELALRAWASVRPTPILARDESAPGRVLELARERAGTLRFAFPCNARGHYDDEFVAARPGETRIAVIGDSFSQGVVPHALHYTTVAERALGVPVDNFGISSIGLPEYEVLLATEVLPLAPALVVVALFVGNDLDLPPETQPRDPALRAWLDRKQVLVACVPRRVAQIAAERRAHPGGPARVAGERAAVDGTLALEERYPWLGDPLLEVPTISADTFHSIEASRATQICNLRDDEVERALRVLERMRSACGERGFAVLLIPDELQIEDELWRALALPELERDRAQRLVGARLAAAGIPVLDLEPALRAAAPLADGRRHVFHAQDTHLNRRGNQIVGEALAQFVRARWGFGK